MTTTDAYEAGRTAGEFDWCPYPFATIPMADWVMGWRSAWGEGREWPPETPDQSAPKGAS